MKQWRRGPNGRFIKPRGRAWGHRATYAAAGYAAYGFRRMKNWAKGSRSARPRMRGRMGNAVAFIGTRNIAKAAKAKISKKKSESYTLDFEMKTGGPGVSGGVFQRITTGIVGQDMNMGGFNVHPIIQANVGSTYGTRRVGLAVNQTFAKMHLCVSSAADQKSTCNRIVLLEVIDRGIDSPVTRRPPNSFQWQDFFESPTVTSFYATKRQNVESGRSMPKYKVLIDRSLVISEVTVKDDVLVNFNIPKHTITVDDTTANETAVAPSLRLGSTRYILFMVTDAATDAGRPLFTGEVRMRYQDP